MLRRLDNVRDKAVTAEPAVAVNKIIEIGQISRPTQGFRVKHISNAGKIENIWYLSCQKSRSKQRFILDYLELYPVILIGIVKFKHLFR